MFVKDLTPDIALGGYHNFRYFFNLIKLED